MALVTSFEPSQKDPISAHRPTRCLYSFVEVSAGRRLLQLDTVGSEDRQFEGKVSQSIQFDLDGAKQLLKLLHEAFPDLAND